MDTIARVRRAFHVQGWSVKKITRELHVSRNTVRKILRSDATEFSYKREHQPFPRMEPWKGDVERFLVSNEGKASRERLTLIRIYEEVRSLGYEGSYDTVRRYAKSWSRKRGLVTNDAYVPLYYAPGEAYQFDWSHEIIRLNGVTTTIKVAHVRLCHSRMMPRSKAAQICVLPACGKAGGPTCAKARKWYSMHMIRLLCFSVALARAAYTII